MGGAGKLNWDRQPKVLEVKICFNLSASLLLLWAWWAAKRMYKLCAKKAVGYP